MFLARGMQRSSHAFLYCRAWDLRGRVERHMENRYRFFNHDTCEFYPCHDMPAERLNCLFCFCPLYALGENCGGNYGYVTGADGSRIKDCSACTLPHHRENYEYVMKRLAE